MDIEELAFLKDRETIAQLNKKDLLDIIEVLQLDRIQWINQFSKTHNESIDVKDENEKLKKHLKVPKACSLKTLEDYKSYYEDTTREQILEDTYIEYCAYVNLAHRYSELKKKYENAVADYETTMFEKEQLNDLVNSCQEKIRQLKKQLEEYKNPLKGIFAQVNDDTLLRDCGNMNVEINELKNQQKEFIKYLEDKINFYKINTQGYSMDLVEEILQKYKSIIGVSDENN